MSDIYKKLSEEFKGEALSKDSSRGFDLTSIKAQYVVERLNEVLGVNGWVARYDILKLDETGCAVKCTLLGHYDDGNANFERQAFGGAQPKKQIGDCIKSAMTDALGKAASHIGVGNDVFKGKVKPPGGKSTYTKPASKPKASAKDVF